MKPQTILIPLILSLTLAACGSTEGSTPDGVWRKRAYVVEVDTPQGVVSGHSVVGHRYDCGYSFPQGQLCSMSTRMEAAAVDLPNGETLYMTVDEYHTFGPPDVWEGNSQENFTGIYRRDKMPNFVMFEDESDPTTLYEVDPEEEFGDGYTIRRAYVDIHTQEEITSDIPRRLPWLKGMKGMISGSTIVSFDDNILNRYGPADFTG